MFRYLLRSTYDEKLNSIDSIPSSKEAVSAFVSITKENDRLVSVIVKNNLGNIVSDEIFKSITRFLNRFIPNFENQPDFAYHVVLLSGALTHFMTYYARNNSELSEEKMTRILETFLSGKIFKLLRASRYLKKVLK